MLPYGRPVVKLHAKFQVSLRLTAWALIHLLHEANNNLHKLVGFQIYISCLLVHFITD